MNKYPHNNYSLSDTYKHAISESKIWRGFSKSCQMPYDINNNTQVYYIGINIKDLKFTSKSPFRIIIDANSLIVIDQKSIFINGFHQIDFTGSIFPFATMYNIWHVRVQDSQSVNVEYKQVYNLNLENRQYNYSGCEYTGLTQNGSFGFLKIDIS